MDMDLISEQLKGALEDLFTAFPIKSSHILVVGTSTSEVIGHSIGSAGSEDVAKTIYTVLDEYQQKYGFHLAFQGCEHINRALTVEKKTAEKFNLEIVSVIPVRKAGGALSTHAYSEMENPVVVEFIEADCGIDIGDTFIGMHLKHVAVPIRSGIDKIGEAHLTMAKTRPKLIGGVRAQYEMEENLQTIREIKDLTDGELC